MATRTKPPEGNAEHYRRAAKHLERAETAFASALAELRPGDDELPFAAQVAEYADGVAHVRRRLGEYAAGGY